MSPLRRLPLIPRRTMFTFLKKSTWRLPPNSNPSIPQQEVVDEEACPDYNPTAFYPARPGEVLAKRFQLLVKIGWGSQLSVWLARDVTRLRWQSERTVALKIINSNNSEDARHEAEIERRIAHLGSEHRGRDILRTCLDDFEVTGPAGKHICLVYEPMREPLWIFQKRFVGRNLPLRIAKAYTYFLLVGLDYLHSECKIVHADLKLGNILMTFENENILTNFVKRQQQMQFKVDAKSGRTIYLCHNDFGTPDIAEVKNMFPKIVDFGLAMKLDSPSTLDGMEGKQVGVYPIQPDFYRAPEVILGYGWDFKADIWNMGVLLWNIFGSTELFQQVYKTGHEYDAKAHLAEMIALLGPPPREMLAKSQAMLEHGWPHPIKNDAGKLCHNAEEFFGGPFFDAEDKFRYKDLVPSRTLLDTVQFLDEEERGPFLSFAQQMLAWQPENRKTARELIDHEFLKLGK